ncbi:MAG TPA: DUF167 domain-containing protein [Blastocatellia bacterium]|nr:DUF167 domain-containing protein [Blastocatellia bacterium]
MVELNEKDGAVTFKLRVQPSASRTEIVGEHGGAIKLRVAAPPVDDRANEECRRFLARLFGVSISSIQIVSGRSSRDKLICVTNTTLPRVKEAFRL